MDLHELEKYYISCLLCGGKVQEITLSSERLEIMHSDIKRLKHKGFVLIPKGLVAGTDNFDYEAEWRQADFIAAEITEAQRKKAINKTINGVISNAPSDMIISNLREELDKIAAKSGKMDILSAEQLQKKDFQNTEFVVEKIIPVGLTILMGAPKMGKSWLLLLLADLISGGLSIFKHKAKRVPVLYFTLEDSAKRCKFRLSKLKDPKIPWTNNLYFAEKANGTIGVMNAIKQTSARVVIIDTFGAFCTVKDGNDYFETTGVIRELKDIADTMQVAIIVVHHTRKNKSEKDSDDWTTEIMGSQGWLGAADTIIFLDRKRGKDKAVLKITGRDITDAFIKIKWNDGYWESDVDG